MTFAGAIRQVRRAAFRLAALLLLGAAASSFAAPPFEDSMGQRMLACTGCHGPEGRAAPDGYYPRIAGKPDGYLFNQLLNFRDGRRHYALMTNLLAPLGDAYLREIAAHFASLVAALPAAGAVGAGRRRQRRRRPPGERRRYGAAVCRPAPPATARP